VNWRSAEPRGASLRNSVIVMKYNTGAEDRPGPAGYVQGGSSSAFESPSLAQGSARNAAT
jgi:hypothetical protein